jgi:hypothetical protein
VVLVSADKDLMQLVGDRVSFFHTGREKLYDAAGVEEDFGVPPAQVVDVLALMGDSIDNVPGVPGIGEKGAKALIREYGSLDELLARAGEVSRKSYREGLEQHADEARMSRSWRPSTATCRSPSTPTTCASTRRTPRRSSGSSPSSSSTRWSRSSPPRATPRRRRRRARRSRRRPGRRRSARCRRAAPARWRWRCSARSGRSAWWWRRGRG